MESLLFDGPTFDARQDGKRLGTLMDRVIVLMRDGQWRTLAAIRGECGGTEASVSARLRDLRKERFGSFIVERRRVDGAPGLWEYRVAGVRKA